jgi:sulfur-carrier protein
MIRVVLPYHLCNLAGVSREVPVEAGASPSIGAVLDALETQYPVLRGTIRDQATRQRRPFIRFFACGQDLSFEPAEFILPNKVLSGEEPLRIIGAMAGG